jgi:hypothetical protein
LARIKKEDDGFIFESKSYVEYGVDLKFIKLSYNL